MFVHLISCIVILFFIFEIVKSVSFLNNSSDDNYVFELRYPLGYKFTVGNCFNSCLLSF